MKNLKTRDFDYSLPAELIAQRPVKPAEAARLMVLHKTTGEILHRRFFDLPELLRAGDVLVLNDSKVIPARLHGRKATGGQIEIFLLREADRQTDSVLLQSAIYKQKNVWRCLVGGKIKPGLAINLNSKVSARPVKKIDDKIWLVEFNCSPKKLLTLGETPLPPYIKSQAKPTDYQTVFAKRAGSVAAPTAGLHFSKQLLSRLKKRGVQIEFVTLHVGLGTFLPVATENIQEHKMHSELAQLDEAAAKRLNQAKKSGRRIIPVGTTALRVLESFATTGGQVKAGTKETAIFIYPGYKFKFISGLITNFHLPKSTLLMLVSALAGRQLILRAYAEAIKQKYRFFSFGDGMLIE